MQPESNRHYDARLDAYVARIAVGEFHVCDSDDVISTVLGSCIAACIRDPVIGLGGMNHFMLPGSGSPGRGSGNMADQRYGVASMEVLINALISRGARKERLEVKLFGGAELMAGGRAPVGRSNVEFARSFLHFEGMSLVAEDCGGPYPRRVQYWPASGRAMVMHMPLDEAKTALVDESNVATELSRRPPEGEIELFT